MYKYSKQTRGKSLSLSEKKERLEKLVSGEVMEKPVKPKKPKFKKSSPPGNVFTITKYLWENLDTGEIKFCEEDEQPEGFLEITSTDMSLIQEFADAFNSKPDDVLVVPNNDRLEYRAIKHLSKEEFLEKKQKYDDDSFHQELLMTGYHKAMEQYKKDKDLWDLWNFKHNGSK